MASSQSSVLVVVSVREVAYRVALGRFDLLPSPLLHPLLLLPSQRLALCTTTCHSPMLAETA